MGGEPQPQDGEEDWIRRLPAHAVATASSSLLERASGVDQVGEKAVVAVYEALLLKAAILLGKVATLMLRQVLLRAPCEACSMCGVHGGPQMVEQAGELSLEQDGCVRV